MTGLPPWADASVVTAALAVLTFIGILVKKIFSAAGKITMLIAAVDLMEPRVTRLEERVNTLWGFLLSRGIAEAVHKGVATMNSPVRVTDEAKSWFAPLLDPLAEFYRSDGHNLSDPELAFEIERRFGPRILQEVCIPKNIYMGACLVIAMQVCRGNAPDIGNLYPRVGKDPTDKDHS